MALFAFDGTWNQAKDNDAEHRNTNVSRFFDAYHANSRNVRDVYKAGVGTRLGVLGKVVGGVFGAGELRRLDEAYDQLCLAWADGDRAIDIVGFSRGAATTLDFCHIIQERGIRKPGTRTVVEASPQIRFLGVWDVVAAFGLANLGATDLNIGHHLSLPKSSLKFAFHALALDERRPSFLPTRLHGAYEVWFRGVHSDVGGGNTNRGLNDITLAWMMHKAKGAGLPILDTDIAALHPDVATAPDLDPKLPLNIRPVSLVDRVHRAVHPMPGCSNPPATCPIETEADEQTARELGADAMEVLPLEARARVQTLVTLAEKTASDLDFPLDGLRDAIVTLIQGRIPLVSTPSQLAQAEQATVRLVTATIRNATKRDFHALNEFFLNEALFDLHPLFPYTD
jgi:type VI secretion system (T6SS) phospholipase Tle1-like effector